MKEEMEVTRGMEKGEWGVRKGKLDMGLRR